MSKPQPQAIQEVIQQEAERQSVTHFGKPFDELDETHKGYAIYGAKRALREGGVTFPGECCDCGARIAKDRYQCRSCHEGDMPRAETWLHKREVVMQ